MLCLLQDLHRSILTFFWVAQTVLYPTFALPTVKELAQLVKGAALSSVLRDREPFWVAIADAHRLSIIPDNTIKLQLGAALISLCVKVGFAIVLLLLPLYSLLSPFCVPMHLLLSDTTASAVPIYQGTTDAQLAI